MKEIPDILAAWHKNPGGTLATVVRLEGSGYRRPGARILINPDGSTIGSISGGCIERDVVYRAGSISTGADALVVRYDSVSEEEAGPAAGLGCGGTIDVLIEPAAAALPALARVWSAQRRGVIATVIDQRNSGAKIGARWVLLECGRVESDPIAWPPDLLEVARQALDRRASRHVHLLIPGGWIDLFVDVIEPPLELFVFGAGADALPLVRLARSLGWRVTVVDLRSGPAAMGRVFDADVVVRGLDSLAIADGAAAVVMNHNWNHDLTVLNRLMDSNLIYLGILGPRRRTERLLTRVEKASQLAEQMHYPVGLDIGAETPEEVALAITAEITSVVRGGCGGRLRDKAGPIHPAAENNTEQRCPVAAS